MIPSLQQALAGKDQYDALPESIKQSYTHEEWLWLSDRQKADLLRLENEPEWDE